MGLITSGGSREGVRGGPGLLLSFRPTEARRAEENFWKKTTDYETKETKETSKFVISSNFYQN